MTNEQNKLADDGTFTSYADLPDGVRKHLLDLEVFIGEVDGKETVITLSDETCVDNGTLDSSDAVVAFNGIVAALRAAAEPVAYAIYGIGAGKVYLHNAKLIADVESDEWKTDDDCLGDHWAGNEPLYRAAQPAPSASVREAIEEAANIANRFGDCPGSFVADRIMEFAADTDATPSPLMAAGEAETSAQVMVDRDLLRRMLGYARNASCPFSGQPEVENWHSRIDADCRYVDAILGAPALESVRTSPQPSRIDAAACASETAQVEDIAKWLHEETSHPDSYPGHGWPETDRDDGQREGGFVKIVPKHAQAYFRDIARRLVARYTFTAPQPSPTPSAARASETVEATSPAKRDYAARDMGVSVDQVESDQVRCGPVGEDDWKDQRIASLEAYIAQLKDQQAMAEPTREETIEAIRKYCRSISSAAIQRSQGEDRIYYAGLSVVGLVDAILALKPSGGQTQEEVDPADLWDDYLSELDGDEPSPQGAMAFAVDALSKPRGEPAREGGEDVAAGSRSHRREGEQ